MFCYFSDTYVNNRTRTKSVSPPSSSDRRFWNTCSNKNEKSAHTCRYICELTPCGESSIYATAGEAAFKLVPYYSEFSRFSIGSKLNRSPQCRHLFLKMTPQRYELILKVVPF